MHTGAIDKEGFSWLRWALIGCAIWVVLMLVLGTTVGILMTPAFGPLLGWLVGGILYQVGGVLTRR